MKKFYVLLDVNSGQYFDGARMEPCFSKDSWREFESEKQAEDRLKEEIEVFPSYFENRMFTILPLYKMI